MKLTRLEKKLNYRADRYEDVKVLTPLGKVVVAAVSIPALGAAFYGIFADRYMDVLGDVNTGEAIPADVVTNEARERAEVKYAAAYDAAPDTGKYALQYLTPTEVVIDTRIHEPNNGTGLLGLVTGTVYGDTGYESFTFNDGCLSNTAWDTNGGDIAGAVRGLFVTGEVEGSVPTAAANPYVDYENDPDVIVIESGHSNSKDLRFTGLVEGNELVPADAQTRNILRAHGCDTGETSNSRVDALTDSSPWIT